jgi:hypothetical protein
VRTKKGNQLHSKGNKLPFFENAKEARECYAREIGTALRSEIAATARSAKDIMRWTRASERAVKGWISGRRGPSGEHLIPLIACSDAVFAAVLKVTGRERSSRSRQVAEVRRLLGETLAALDQVDR